MDNILKELENQQNVRINLSNLRQLIKDNQQLNECKLWFTNKMDIILSFLQSEDAKIRKNAALLLGDMKCQQAVNALFASYRNEMTLFVKSAYLTALSELDVEQLLPDFRDCLEALLEQEVTDENRKHINEEIRVLRRIIIAYDGIEHHTFHAKGQMQEVLLITNRMQRDFICSMIRSMECKIHPLGVLVRTDQLEQLQQIRMYREALFPVHINGLLPNQPLDAAKELWKSDLYTILTSLHKEAGPFYFRVECKSARTLEQRSDFSKKFSVELERCSGGQLVNSTTDYEIEIRLIASKEGTFFPCVKCYTWKDERFAYRKNSISASIHPSTAALIMELAKPYLKENAQIMDPFCGVGTMLIERDKCVPAREIYATDIFGEAIVKGRENASFAKKTIHFIHRDFFDFHHDYLFDEIVTNMPIRGKRTKEEMDALYALFFKKVLEITERNAVIVMYTNEIGFVKKQLRIHKEFQLLQETCLQNKTEFHLLIIGIKR